jgi:hypothetical protein
VAPQITVAVGWDDSAVKSGVQGTNQQLQGMGDQWKGMLTQLATFAAGIFTVAKIKEFAQDSMQAAVDLNKTGFQVAQVFGAASGQVTEFAKSAATGLGLSQAEAQRMSSSLGLLLQNMGLNQQQAAGMSTEMVTLAAKMAAFHQADPSDVLHAIQSGLAGNTRGLREYGISLDTARIQQKAVELGLIEQGGALDAASKAQASYALIMEQTTAAQAAEISQAKIYAAQVENLQAAIGNALLPAKKALLQIANQLLSALTPLIEAIAGNEVVIGILTVAITSIVVALTAAKIAIGIYSTVTSLATIITTLFGASFLAAVWPIALIVAGIVALVAIVIWAYQNVDWFRNAVNALGDVVLRVAAWIRDALVGAFNAVVGAIKWVAEWVQWLGGILEGLLGKLRDALSLGGRIPGIGGLSLQVLSPTPAWSPLVLAGTALSNPYAVTGPAEATEELISGANRPNYVLNLYPQQADLTEVLVAFRRLELLGS